jgi:suppressor for copper-sensitivity B
MFLGRAGWRLALLFVAGCTVLAADAANVASSSWHEAAYSRVRLVSTATAIDETTTITLGLHIRLDPGWHTYWRSSGVGGIPPRFDWSGSGNLRAVEVEWPAPQRFSLYGNENYGYADEVVLPITAFVERAREPLVLRLHLDYAVCADMCVPIGANLALDLPAGPAASTVHQALVAGYRARVPRDGVVPGFTIEVVTASADEPRGIAVVARAEPRFEAPDVFVDGVPDLAFGAPRRRISEDGHDARMWLEVYGGDADTPLVGQALTITLVDGERLLERTLRIAEPTPP